MSFQGMTGFARLTNLLMNLALGCTLALVLLLSVQIQTGLPVFSLTAFFQALLLSTCVGYTFGDLIPTLMWGERFAVALRIKRGLARHVVISAVLDLVNVSCILAICSLINTIAEGGITGTIAFFLQAYPTALLSGFLAILLVLPLAQKIASGISGFKPEPKAQRTQQTQRTEADTKPMAPDSIAHSL
jgi:hypothetical protein